MLRNVWQFLSDVWHAGWDDDGYDVIDWEL